MSDDHAAALAANQAFYDAFAAGDIRQMEAAWAKDAPVACAHPGAPLLVGRAVVLESWASILKGGGKGVVQILRQGGEETEAHAVHIAGDVVRHDKDLGAKAIRRNRRPEVFEDPRRIK